ERLLGENGAFVHDWKARVNAPLSQRVHVNRGGTLPRRPPVVLAQDIGPGLVHQGREWRVTAAPAEHVQPFLDSLAYRLEGADGRGGPRPEARPGPRGPAPRAPRPNGEGHR